jgi:hypothetical protein
MCEKGKLRTKTRRVSIKNGKGYKEMVLRLGGKTRRARKPLTKKEIHNIRFSRVIPGLFRSCKTCIENMD